MNAFSLYAFINVFVTVYQNLTHTSQTPFYYVYSFTLRGWQQPPKATAAAIVASSVPTSTYIHRFRLICEAEEAGQRRADVRHAEARDRQDDRSSALEARGAEGVRSGCQRVLLLVS